MIPRPVRNLLCPGRAVCVERDVLGPLRVMAPCMAMGEACGVASAQIARNRISAAELNVSSLRDRLREVGAMVDRQAFALDFTAPRPFNPTSPTHAHTKFSCGHTALGHCGAPVPDGDGQQPRPPTLSVLAPTLKAQLHFGSVEYSYVVTSFLAAYTLGYTSADRCWIASVSRLASWPRCFLVVVGHGRTPLRRAG